MSLADIPTVLLLGPVLRAIVQLVANSGDLVRPAAARTPMLSNGNTSELAALQTRREGRAAWRADLDLETGGWRGLVG